MPAGYGWVVQFLSDPGDQPMIQASLRTDNAVHATRARVDVEEMEAGGVLISPLPADFFRQTSHTSAASSVDLSVNGVAALCQGSCTYESTVDLQPSFTIQSQSRISTGIYSLTLTGSKLSSGDQPPEVDVQGIPCIIDSHAAAEIVCTISYPFLAPKKYSVSVRVPSYGTAEILDDSMFTYELQFERVSPSSFDPKFPQTITVYGAGFHPDMSKNIVLVGGDSTCNPISVNASQLICALNPSQASSRREAFTMRFSVLCEGCEESTSLVETSVNTATNALPIVNSIIPSSGSVGGGDFVILNGADFSMEPSDLIVMFGGAKCEVNSSTMDKITCITGVHAPGVVSSSVQYSKRLGISDPSSAPSFEYVLKVSAITPSLLGLGGGVALTVSGDGMTPASGKDVSGILAIAGAEQYIVGVYYPISSTRPSGSWSFSVGSLSTEQLDVGASAQAVKDAILAASFEGVLDVEVAAADDLPGKFVNKKYSRQWEVRLTRNDIPGLSLDRCTSPLYIDWDPDACPSVAPDLFMHHYWWYWPPLLPKPADLKDQSKREGLQRLCDNEARSFGLKPGFCQALVPPETLPTCGEGSGIKPPCWQERFTVAKVRLNDGTDVLYERDDARSHGDATMGYRFWKRTDLESFRLARMPSVSSNIDGMTGAGVHIYSGRSRAEQQVWFSLVLVQCYRCF